MSDQNQDHGIAEKISKAPSLEDLLKLALSELGKFTDGAEIVLGPTDNGGYDNLRTNLKVIKRTVEVLKKEGRPIFDERPYQERISVFTKNWQEKNPDQLLAHLVTVLEEFYRPLYEIGIIKTIWLIPGWDVSFEAGWKHDRLMELHVETRRLSASKIDALLQE